MTHEQSSKATTVIAADTKTLLFVDIYISHLTVFWYFCIFIWLFCLSVVTFSLLLHLFCFLNSQWSDVHFLLNCGMQYDHGVLLLTKERITCTHCSIPVIKNTPRFIVAVVSGLRQWKQ